MRIGELASQARVSVQSIRFYEREGLLRKPPRSASGYRNYERADLERITFIKWCQPLGFTLREVRGLMQLHSALSNLPRRDKAPEPRALQKIIRMAEQKVIDLDKKIELLRTASGELTLAIRKLETSQACPAGPGILGHSSRKRPKINEVAGC
jgi:DNA-binding transcriptional MerR regulator